jgi:hypothetical protein
LATQTVLPDFATIPPACRQLARLDWLHITEEPTMRAKFILPALIEAKSPFWRPIKYSLFPPLGLATLAGHMQADDEVELVDEHVEEIDLSEAPDLVVIQVYITNAYRAYELADHYRQRGSHVILGGLHVTSMPQEACRHADTLVLGPADEAFAQFLADFRRGKPRRLYYSLRRSLEHIPDARRDLIKRELYLAPNSLVVSRGCPKRCDLQSKGCLHPDPKNQIDDFIRSAAKHTNCQTSDCWGITQHFLDI